MNLAPLRLNGQDALMQTSSGLLRIAPEDLTREALRVIPLGQPEWNRGGSPPFAAVIAADPGTSLADSAKLCIHVFKESSGYSFSDGVLALEGDGCPLITSNIPWPELNRALSADFRPWWPLLIPRAGQRPYLAVKNWQQGDSEFDPKTAKGRLTAVSAVAILRRWNGWEQNGLPWKNRLDGVPGAGRGDSADDLRRAVNRLEKYCAEIGLRKGAVAGADTPNLALLACIAVAEAVLDAGSPR